MYRVCKSFEFENNQQRLEKLRRVPKPPDILSGASTDSANFAPYRRAPISGALDEISETGLVPLAGLEPAQCCHYLILSQARLPIPPQGLAGGIIVGNGVGSTLCVAVPTQ
jgi:hypothetical protein